MQKTKLGVSVGLLGAAAYFAALFGGYIPMILIVGYILLFEENEWLKKSGVKAVALAMSFAFLLSVIGLVPDVLSWVSSVAYVFKGSFSYSLMSSTINVITGAIDIVRTCLFLMLGLKAFNQGTVSVPFVDNMINKYV